MVVFVGDFLEVGFLFNEENDKKFETERCTENFQAKFDEMEMLEQVLTKGAYVAARHRVCCSEAGRKPWMDIEHHAVLIAAPLMGIVDIAVQQHAFRIVEVTNHGLHGVENLHPLEPT